MGKAKFLVVIAVGSFTVGSILFGFKNQQKIQAEQEAIVKQEFNSSERNEIDRLQKTFQPNDLQNARKVLEALNKLPLKSAKTKQYRDVKLTQNLVDLTNALLIHLDKFKANEKDHAEEATTKITQLKEIEKQVTSFQLFSKSQRKKLLGNLNKLIQENMLNQETSLESSKLDEDTSSVEPTEKGIDDPMIPNESIVQQEVVSQPSHNQQKPIIPVQPVLPNSSEGNHVPESSSETTQSQQNTTVQPAESSESSTQPAESVIPSENTTPVPTSPSSVQVSDDDHTTISE